jgi:predicted small secreted protein
VTGAIVGNYIRGGFAMRKLTVLVLAVWCLTALGGCNTIRGAGKDVEKVGEGIQKSTQ